ncbi:diguanylate cyclase (GGDEF)-like protein [Rhodococcus sp. 27YEA15]|uniref:GGDEF domain-containing protein n=1 Tax=Rhodococcus sp. 27YEA15 TaxID=3156259 RepID=UPI003C7C3D79
MTGLTAQPSAPRARTCPVAATYAEWWESRSEYNWLPRFLDTRNLTGPGRKIVALWCVLIALLAATMQLSDFGADSVFARTVLATGTLTGLAAGVFWSGNKPWPRRGQSIVFVLWADLWLAITLFFGIRTAFVGAMGCTLFVIIGFYVALVHSPRIAVVHLSWAMLVCTALTARAVREPGNDFWVVVNMYLTISCVIVSTVWALQMVWKRLTDDVRNSRRDYLTATLNRRGLQDEAEYLLQDDRHRTKALMVLLIDVDSFKRLNDTHGHGAGDDALTAVADRVVAAAGPEAVVARIGGDEFVVLRTVERDDIEQVAVDIHSSVSSPADPFPVSASTGVSVYLPTDTALPERAVNSLIDYADNAMYRAKKRGGNRIAWVQMLSR